MLIRPDRFHRKLHYKSLSECIREAVNAQVEKDRKKLRGAADCMVSESAGDFGAWPIVTDHGCVCCRYIRITIRLIIRYNDPKSATTSRAGGMRKAPRRGRGHAQLVVADLISMVNQLKEILLLVSILKYSWTIVRLCPIISHILPDSTGL